MSSTIVRKWFGLITGAVIGGLVGYSQILCPDGQCALTGSWYGGAAVGGLAGMILLGGGCCAGGACAVKPSQPDDNPAQ